VSLVARPGTCCGMALIVCLLQWLCFGLAASVS
jgi:hypothetical protein